MKYLGFALSLGLLVGASCKSAPQTEGDPAGQPPSDSQDVTATETDSAIIDSVTADELLANESQRLTLEEQKNALLLEQHLLAAEAAIDGLRFADAERELNRALSVDPDSVAAKRRLADVRALQGTAPGETAALLGDAQQSYEVRVQQLRTEAEENVRRGERLLMRGDQAGAIAEARLALDHVRWAPVSLDWQGVDERAQALLNKAEAERAGAEQARREEAERAALEALRAEEQALRQRSEARLVQLIDQSIAAFDAEAYDESVALADRALREDPRNDQAMEIRDAAFRAGREKVRSDYILLKRERFKRWQQAIQGMRIPNTEIVTLPSEEFWNGITDLRSQRQGLALEETEDPVDTQLREQLGRTRVPALLIEDEEDLGVVVGYLSTVTGLPLVVDPLATQAAFEAGAVFSFDLPNPLTVDRALNLITAAAGPDVTWTVRLNAVLVTTRSKARGNLVLHSHDVQDLLFRQTNFLAERLDRIRLIDELEDDDGGGPFGGRGETVTLLEPDALEELIRTNVAPSSWADEEGGVITMLSAGNMVIRNTREVQLQVQQFLQDMRRFNSSIITIDSKFLRIADNFIQEIGVEWRGIDNPGTPFTDLDDVTSGLEDNASLGLDNFGTGVGNGNDAGPPSAGFFYDDGEDGDFKGSTANIFGNALGNALSTFGGMTTQFSFLDDASVSVILRAIEKNQQIELVNNQTVSVSNTQQAFVSVINQRAYIQDFEVEVAQFEAIADPVINVLNEGVVLEVRPTIQHDRKYIRMELQPTVARVVALRDFATNLGGTVGSPVEFQLPELEVQSVSTTAIVPDGGTILLGGLSRIRNVERRAEVPWLANIPLLGFFFKTEGYNDEKSSLMIMIRAAISDVRDEVARLERGR